MTPQAAQDILEQAFAPWVRALQPTITEIGAEREHHRRFTLACPREAELAS